MIVLYLSCFEPQKPANEIAQQELAELDKMVKNPQQSSRICAKTTFSAVKKQCEKLKNRPHLYNNRPSQKGATNRLPTSYKSPLWEVKPNKNRCSDGNYDCHLQAAKQENTQQGRAAQCLAISNATWRSECFFEVAEQGLIQKKLSYAESADLCSLSSPFLYNCLQHLSIVLAEQQKTLKAYARAGTEINSFWKERDKKVLTKMEDIYWSTAMEMFYSNHHTIDQTPFQTLPAHAHPHIWAGISRKIVKTTKEKQTLEEWTQDLQKVYVGEKNIKFSEKNPPRDQRRPQFPQNKRSSFKQVIYSEAHTRILGENITEEIQISLLYSSALYKKFSDWREEAKNSTSPRIQEMLK